MLIDEDDDDGVWMIFVVVAGVGVGVDVDVVNGMMANDILDNDDYHDKAIVQYMADGNYVHKLNPL